MTGTSTVDGGAPPGVTVTYRVLATAGEAESEGCGAARATAVPELPGSAVILASIGGLAAFAVVRKRPG